MSHRQAHISREFGLPVQSVDECDLPRVTVVVPQMIIDDYDIVIHHLILVCLLLMITPITSYHIMSSYIIMYVPLSPPSRVRVDLVLLNHHLLHGAPLSSLFITKFLFIYQSIFIHSCIHSFRAVTTIGTNVFFGNPAFTVYYPS